MVHQGGFHDRGVNSGLDAMNAPSSLDIVALSSIGHTIQEAFLQILRRFATCNSQVRPRVL
jgi:hypothetical protein